MRGRQRGVTRNAQAHPQDWETLERQLHAAGVSPEEIKAGARTLFAQARGHHLAETRRLLSLAQREIVATMGVDIVNVAEPWKSRANSRANTVSSCATPGNVGLGKAQVSATSRDIQPRAAASWASLTRKKSLVQSQYRPPVQQYIFECALVSFAN